MIEPEQKPSELVLLEDAAYAAWKALQAAEWREVEARNAATNARVAWEEVFVARERTLKTYDQAERRRMGQTIVSLQEELGHALEALRRKTNQLIALKAEQDRASRP